jgi:hypothetical protein
MDETLNRRRLLKLGGVAGTAALAGCSNIPVVGGGGGGGNYKQWMYAPGEFGDSDHYRTWFVNANQVENNEDALSDNADSSFDAYTEQYNGQHGLDRNDMDTALTLGLGQVITGSFSADDVSGELEDNDYDDDTDHEGYTIYTKDEASMAFGVQDGTIVVGTTGGFYSSSDEDPDEIVEGIIDTSNGDVERYQSDSDDMSKLLNMIGTGTLAYTYTQEEVDDGNPDYAQFEGMVGSGAKWTINGDNTQMKSVYLFDSGDDITIDDIEDYADDSLDDYDNVNVNKNGRAAVVKGKVATDDLFDN